MSCLKYQFNRVVLVRSVDLKTIEKLHSKTDHPSEISQRGNYYGFGAYFDIPRPCKETGKILNAYYQILDGQDDVEYLHCSSLTLWMSLEKFLEEGFAFREEK